MQCVRTHLPKSHTPTPQHARKLTKVDNYEFVINPPKINLVLRMKQLLEKLFDQVFNTLAYDWGGI